MRFDLTVNEFTRDLWAERPLEVFGELFWRPYVHVRDAARAVALVLASPAETVAGEVFNAGHSDENYRKLDLVEIITGRLQRGDVSYVSRDEDPRDYKVSFEKIKRELGFEPRMRFDLTVNEFTRDLWAGKKLDVFGELFWRPYIHVRDAARAVALVLASPAEKVSGQVFNAGHSDENYRKLDLVEIITEHLGRGDVEYVKRDEDPRDYKVSFEKIREQLGFQPQNRIPDGIAEITGALEDKAFGDPYDGRYSNI